MIIGPLFMSGYQVVHTTQAHASIIYDLMNQCLKEFVYTGKFLSEALIFASTNPYYDDRLFLELRVQYMKIVSSEHVENMLCTQIVFLFLF